MTNEEIAMLCNEYFLAGREEMKELFLKFLDLIEGEHGIHNEHRIKKILEFIS